jgi:hypothetical protein
MTRAKLLPLLAGFLLAFPATAGASKLLRLNGIGPLKLGMARSAALGTGWLGRKTKGCKFAPHPVTYTMTGTKAPAKVTGLVEFRHGKLTSISISHGVHTATGVIVGKSTSAQMVSDYRKAGFGASTAFDPTLGGRFTTVKRNGSDVIQGFGVHKIVTLLAIPAVQLCD